MIVWRVSAPGDNGKSSASTRAPHSRHQGVDRSRQGSRPRFRFDQIRAVFAHRLVTPPPEITRKCRFWCRRSDTAKYIRERCSHPPCSATSGCCRAGHGRRAIPGNVFQDGQSLGILVAPSGPARYRCRISQAGCAATWHIVYGECAHAGHTKIRGTATGAPVVLIRSPARPRKVTRAEDEQEHEC